MRAFYRSLYLESPKIKVMGKHYCEYCTKAKDLLKEHNLEFVYEEVDDPSTFQYDTVPQIWIGDTHIGGFSDLKNVVAAFEPLKTHVTLQS